MMEDRKHFRQRQINGCELSMNGGYYDGNDCCDPAQPPFLQQYHQRQGPSDFRQASRYTMPRIQEAAGLNDSAYTAPYKDDSGLGEKRLFPYQKNGSVDGFGWRRGSSEHFRDAGKGMTGSSLGRLGFVVDIRGGGARRDYTSRECEDEMHQGRGSNSSRDFRGGGATSSLNEYQGRDIREVTSNRNDFKQGDSTWSNPRERGRRLMLNNRQMGRQGGYDRGIESRDDYYNSDMRYDDDDRRSINSSGVYGHDRREDDRMSMNYIGGGRGYGRRDDGRRLMNYGGYGYGRQDDGSRVSTWINPREHETRQLLDGRLAVYRCGFNRGIHNRDDRVRNGYCGVDGDDDYNNMEVRCVEDGIRLMNNDDGYGYDRWDDDYYDPEILGRDIKCDPSQPLFAQQYYQRRCSTEDDRQSNRYTLPQVRQVARDYDSNYKVPYKDGSGFGETRRLLPYRVNDRYRVNDLLCI